MKKNEGKRTQQQLTFDIFEFLLRDKAKHKQKKHYFLVIVMLLHAYFLFDVANRTNLIFFSAVKATDSFKGKVEEIKTKNERRTKRFKKTHLKFNYSHTNYLFQQRSKRYYLSFMAIHQGIMKNHFNREIMLKATQFNLLAFCEQRLLQICITRDDNFSLFFHGSKKQIRGACYTSLEGSNSKNCFPSFFIEKVIA